jgi:hypothetical protein
MIRLWLTLSKTNSIQRNVMYSPSPKSEVHLSTITLYMDISSNMIHQQITWDVPFHQTSNGEKGPVEGLLHLHLMILWHMQWYHQQTVVLLIESHLACHLYKIKTSPRTNPWGTPDSTCMEVYVSRQRGNTIILRQSLLT